MIFTSREQDEKIVAQDSIRTEQSRAARRGAGRGAGRGAARAGQNRT